MWNLYNKKRYEDGQRAMAKAVERTYKEYLACDAYTVLCQPYKIETAEGLGINPETSHIYAIENPEYIVQKPNFDKEKIVLFCGRFENWSKRIDRLLRIWEKVQDRLPDWRLVLVGNGESWDMLTRMADELSLKRVSFEGLRSNASDYYRKASIVVLTSQTEGWGLTLTEAQAHGCIPIAFGCTSGIKEVLSSGEGCGIEVAPFDEDEFAQQLVNVARMSEEEQMGLRRNAIDRIKRYTPEIISEKWRVLFDKLSINNEQ
jgi:glycosyltransferase involved in cell wall biosynthesis